MAGLMILVLSGCATMTGRPAGGVDDPLEPMNRAFYHFNSEADRWVMTPVSNAYVAVTPKPVRGSLTNFFDNVSYPNVIVNDFLQGRVVQGASDIGRFVVNSTLGMLGFFDVAGRLGLKAHTEDAGLTLARWGVPRGPYLVLPFVGPDTLRNTPSIAFSIFTNVLYYVGNAAVTVPLSIISVINTRANATNEIEYVRRNAVDPYIFTRDAYLQHRNYLIHGKHLGLNSVEQLMLPPGTPVPTPGKPRVDPPLKLPRPWPKRAAIRRPPVPAA
ncbi:MAG: VacJ family lipoprotein [Gammaproteobacteria bacterium]|nr:VacJ family lipoprotein [Gammaproteobacteria bacterium]